MTGFDFLENQHYLFLLLYALQGFSDEDWGFLPGFEGLTDGDTVSLDLTDAWVDNHNEKKPTFTGGKKNMRKPYRCGFNGRATGVLFGSVEVDGGKRDVALKLSWTEKDNHREKAFIDEAANAFSDIKDHNPCEYLPTILATQEYLEFDYGPLFAAVLQEAEISERARTARVPYLLVMPKYEPIYKLTNDWGTFMEDFIAIFYCES